MLTTEPSRRRYLPAALAGVLAGVISAVIKLGWEIPFPPRTPARDATNPPQALLELLGMSSKSTHATYLFNDNARPYVSFIVHFAFSIAFVVFYCVVAEKYPQIKLWQGVAFGLAVSVGLHLVIMPLLGVVPAPWDQPFAEHFAELSGHVAWMWVAELTRRDLRNRITHEPDAEAPLDAPR